MFVLLQHETGDGLHWDFMIEVPGRELLPTWRLAENPIGRAGEIAAEPIGEHRRRYLDYEGDISGGRGRVRRVDRGEADVIEFGPHRLTARLHGRSLSGVVRIETVGDQAKWGLCNDSTEGAAGRIKAD
jgi:hypothetical protein